MPHLRLVTEHLNVCRGEEKHNCVNNESVVLGFQRAPTPPIVIEITPKLRLFTLILDKFFLWITKFQKYSTPLPCPTPPTPTPVIFNYFSPQLQAYKSAGLRSLEYRFFRCICKGNRVGALLPKTLPISLTEFFSQKIHIYRLIFLAFSFFQYL